MQHPQQPIRGSEKRFLQMLGFQFDPFQHLEASADSHLVDYMVGHEVFAAAWDATPSLIFAPPGGGKTAMRLYTERACWSSFGPRHPFPILHQPALGDMDEQEFPLEEHCRRLAQSAARSLLLGLAIQPERLLDCSPHERRRVGNVLAALPRHVTHYANTLRATGDVTALVQRLGRTAWFGAPVRLAPEKLDAFCTALSAVDSVTQSLPGDGCQQLVEIGGVLIDVLGYRCVYLLIDGIDALPESAQTPAAGARWLHSLLAAAEGLAARQFFVKGFLPSGYEGILNSSRNGHRTLFAQTSLSWSPELLAELIRRRVAVASGGAFGSLDAISSPALRDVETLISKRVPSLPREAIVFVGELLRRAAQDAGDSGISLEPEHLEATAAWYQAEGSRLGMHWAAPTPVPPAKN